MINKTTKIFLLLTLLLMLAACGANSASDSASPTDTPPPDITYIPYSDEELGITLVHPEGWVTAGGYGGLTVASSQEVIDGESLADMGDNGFVLIIPGELGIFNKQTGQNFTDKDALQILEVYKQLLEREGQSHLGIEPPRELVIDRQPAAMMVTSSEVEGQTLITIIAVIMNDDYMALISAASVDTSAAEMRPIFEHVINSIALTNPFATE